MGATYTYTCPDCGEHEFHVEFALVGTLEDHGDGDIEHRLSDDPEPELEPLPTAHTVCKWCEWEGPITDTTNAYDPEEA